jgi:hypothetical protein
VASAELLEQRAIAGGQFPAAELGMGGKQAIERIPRPI